MGSALPALLASELAVPWQVERGPSKSTQAQPAFIHNCSHWTEQGCVTWEEWPKPMCLCSVARPVPVVCSGSSQLCLLKLVKCVDLQLLELLLKTVSNRQLSLTVPKGWVVPSWYCILSEKTRVWVCVALGFRQPLCMTRCSFKTQTQCHEEICYRKTMLALICCKVIEDKRTCGHQSSGNLINPPYGLFSCFWTRM